MASHVTHGDLDQATLLEHVVIVTPDFGGRLHEAGDLQALNGLEFRLFWQNHFLQAPGNGQFRPHAQILGF